MARRDSFDKILGGGLWPRLKELGFERAARRTFVRKTGHAHWTVGFERREYEYFDTTGVYYPEIDGKLREIVPERLHHRLSIPQMRLNQPVHFYTDVVTQFWFQLHYREVVRIKAHQPRNWLERWLSPKPNTIHIGPPAPFPDYRLPKFSWLQKTLLPHLGSQLPGLASELPYFRRRRGGWDPLDQDAKQMAADIRDYWERHCLQWLEACADMRFALKLPWNFRNMLRFELLVLGLEAGDEEVVAEMSKIFSRHTTISDEDIFRKIVRSSNIGTRTKNDRVRIRKDSVPTYRKTLEEEYQIYNVILYFYKNYKSK